MNAATSQSHEYGITLLRLSLGAMWLSHGLLKLFVYTLPGTAQFFESLGIPGWLAYPVVSVEVIAGISLILGVFSRQVSIIMVPILIVATVPHIANGWLFSSSGGGWEYPVFLIISSIAIYLLGDGKFNLMTSQHLVPQAKQ